MRCVGLDSFDSPDSLGKIRRTSGFGARTDWVQFKRELVLDLQRCKVKLIVQRLIQAESKAISPSV